MQSPQLGSPSYVCHRLREPKFSRQKRHWHPWNHDPLCKQMQTKERKSYAVASSQAFASKGLLEFFFSTQLASFFMILAVTHAHHILCMKVKWWFQSHSHTYMALCPCCDSAWKKKKKVKRSTRPVAGLLGEDNEVTLSHLVSDTRFSVTMRCGTCLTCGHTPGKEGETMLCMAHHQKR